MRAERIQGRKTAPVVGLVAILAACSPGQDAPVRVFAAASATDALDDALSALSQAGGPAAVAVVGPSSSLARQIEHGAPADLFLSADQAWMDHLEGLGLLDDASRRDLLATQLVVVSPTGDPVPLAITSPGAWATALGSGRLALADPEHVPAGRYAQQALQWAGAWSTVADRLAPAADVRRALAFVAQATAPLGVVYATDAAASDAVQTVATFPEAAHRPIVFPLALTAKGATRAAARDVATFLAGPEGQARFAHHGFGTP